MLSETASPIERLQFDSTLLSPADGFDRYCSLYAGGAEVVQTGPGPRAILSGWRLDRVILYDRQLDGIGHQRSRTRVAQDGFTHATATIVLAGGFAMDAGEGWQTLKPGETMLLDMTRPMQNRADNAHVVTLSLARDSLDWRMALSALHGRVLPPSATRLLRGFVVDLLDELPAMSVRMVGSATLVLCTLLQMALEQTPGLGAGRTDADRVRRLRNLVDEHLTDPDFDAARASALSGLSRATLYRLTEPFGGVAAFIRARRLEKVRKLLLAEAPRRSVAQIAELAGWRSESHLSRSFKTAFGQRPGEYRDGAERLKSDAPIQAMLSWQDELR